MGCLWICLGPTCKNKHHVSLHGGFAGFSSQCIPPEKKRDGHFGMKVLRIDMDLDLFSSDFLYPHQDFRHGKSQINAVFP